jgi:hypothetical protein
MLAEVSTINIEEVENVIILKYAVSIIATNYDTWNNIGRWTVYNKYVLEFTQFHLLPKIIAFLLSIKV